VAEPVLLISSDPSLGEGLAAVAAGRVRVARLDPARRPVTWPAEPAATVVLDVTARERTAFHAWVRRHHPGPLVVVLKPGEHSPVLAPDPDLVVVGRPLPLVDLVAILEHPPDPAPPWPADASPDPGPSPRPGPRVPVPVLVGLAVLLVLAAALVGATLNLHG
jgi:hypothetical protein